MNSPFIGMTELSVALLVAIRKGTYLLDKGCRGLQTVSPPLFKDILKRKISYLSKALGCTTLKGNSQKFLTNTQVLGNTEPKPWQDCKSDTAVPGTRNSVVSTKFPELFKTNLLKLDLFTRFHPWPHLVCLPTFLN